MILVLCGTQKQNFSRMIREVEKLADDHKIIVQTGHSQYNSDKMELFDFITREKLTVLYEKADYIITHAGAGSLFQAIKFGKRIIAVPRMKKYGEHVDDHQLQLVHKLQEMEYLLTFNDGDEMIDLFNSLKEFKPNSYDLVGYIPLLVNEQLEKIFGIVN